MTPFSFRVNSDASSEQRFDPFDNEVSRDSFYIAKEAEGQYYFRSINGLELKKAGEGAFAFTTAKGILMTLKSRTPFGRKSWTVQATNGSSWMAKMIFSGCKEVIMKCSFITFLRV